MTVIVELEVLDCPMATEEEIEKDIRYAEDMIGMNCYYKIKSISFDYMTEDKKVRPCKDSWEYCDGNCAECEKSHVTISDHTE